MFWAVVRLVSAYVALRFNYRDAGLDYRANEFLHAVEDLRLRLVRTYWARVKEARARERTDLHLEESATVARDPTGVHAHHSRLPQPAGPTSLCSYRIRRGLQRTERPGDTDPTNPNGPPEAA